MPGYVLEFFYALPFYVYDSTGETVVIEIKNASMSDKKRRTLWISDDLWDRLAAAAREDGRTASEYVRRLLLSALDPTR